MDSLKAVADLHNLTTAEIALRWISHHSLMSREHGDSVLIGASSTTHIEQVSGIDSSILCSKFSVAPQNLLDLEKDALRMCSLPCHCDRLLNLCIFQPKTL